jgi:AbrB family looped-hinge helix DNA binding protein
MVAKVPRKADTVAFTTKGQVVIPQWLRKEFEIEEGTRAMVYQEGGRIVLEPMTAKRYRALRGSLKGTGALKALEADRKKEREL